MSEWSFLLSKRWAGYLALAIAFAIACAFLANWQFARRAEAQVELAKLDGNYESAPVPLDQILTDLKGWDDSNKWTPVQIHGTYLTDEQMLVRNRPRGGHPGFEVLVPLQQADGTVFVVDRGWVPTGEHQDAPDHVPAAPAGEVTVVARLKAGEPTLPGRTAYGDQIATIRLPEVADRLDLPVFTGAYGLLVSEDPPVADMPYDFIKPARDEGPHLSYAIQWYIFAAIGFAGLGYGAMRERRARLEAAAEEQEATSDEPANSSTLREPRRPVRRSDAEIEDELIDSGAGITR